MNSEIYTYGLLSNICSNNYVIITVEEIKKTYRRENRLKESEKKEAATTSDIV